MVFEIPHFKVYFNASTWRAVDGLNSSLPGNFAAMDLCLRLAAEVGLRTTYVGSAALGLVDAH